MKRAIVVLMILSLAASALAVDLTNTRELPVKVRGTPVVQGTPDNREGGETIATAFPILALPFTDTGNTCDNIHDYDEVCNYTGSLSPDVVYSYAAASDLVMLIDLCGSLYDTKTYVYDAGMNVVGCNDDYYGFGDPCGSYVSFLTVELQAGNTYYIVIDGYGSDCGDYVLAIDGFVPEPVVCPPDAQPEGEPAVYDGYVDVTNGGCNSTPNVFGTIDWINAEPMSPYDGQAWMCGTSGWYVNSTGGNSRDTDWFLVTAATSGTMEYMLHGEYGMNMYVLDPVCDPINVVAEAYAYPGAPTTVSWYATAGQSFWLWAGPADFTGPVTSFDYYVRVSGNAYNTVPNEDRTFSEVKAMFR